MSETKYEVDLNLIKQSIKLVEDKVCRDFEEIRELQNSKLLVEFTNKTIAFIQNKLFKYFVDKRPEYSVHIKNGANNIVVDSKYSIYINALAGIQNFLHGIPYFCTTILVKEKDKPVVSFVNNYATNEMFYAVKNKCAFLNNQKIRVSKRIDTNNALIAVKYDLSRNLFKNILNKLPMFKVNNCSVLDVCCVACGRYDCAIVLDGNKEDLDMSKLIIEEAGGLSYDMKNNSVSCLFANGGMMDGLVKMVEM